MGHTAVLLPSGSILIYGGLSPNHVALSDLQLLDPLTYTWAQLEISDASMASPALAWHSATLVAGGVIVVAFGLDGRIGVPSNQFWFLSIDESSGTYTWTDTFDGNGAASASVIAARSSMPMPKLARRGETFAKKAVEFIPNPKAEADGQGSSASGSIASTSQAVNAGNGAGPDAAPVPIAPPTEASNQAQATTSSIPRYTPPLASKASTSASTSSSTTPKSLPVDTKSNSSSSTGTIIGASVGAIGGAVALVGLVFYFLRRKAAASSNSFRGPITPAMAQAGSGSGAGDPNTSLVSQLLYTRPVQARNLSLGSTAPAFSPRDAMDGDQDEFAEPLALPGEDMAGVGSRGGGKRGGVGVGLGVAQDPFADQHRVNEVGQLERSGSGASSTDGIVGTAAAREGGDTSGVGAALQASVRSIPFLSSIARTTTADSPAVAASDSFTAPAPTLASRRGGSIRRPRGQNQSDVPMPGTPAELIGMAITSDDGHDALPYLMVSSPSESSYDGASAGHATVLPSSAQPPVRIPAILRPATPLRVANPDPFEDQ